jgi:hypothetical protein
MVAMRCTRVERWIFGYYMVKYSNEPDPIKKPLLGMRHCPEEAVVTVHHQGFTFHWCAEHAKSPTCGAVVVPAPLESANAVSGTEVK